MSKKHEKAAAQESPLVHAYHVALAEADAAIAAHKVTLDALVPGHSAEAQAIEAEAHEVKERVCERRNAAREAMAAAGES